MANNNAARRRDLRNEEPYVANTRTLKDLARLRRDLIDLVGCSPAEAAGICAWVLAKAVGEPDVTSVRTRTIYRKRLSDLAGKPHNMPGAGWPGSLMGTLFAMPLTRPLGLLGVLALAPIMLDGPDDAERAPDVTAPLPTGPRLYSVRSGQDRRTVSSSGRRVE